MKVQTRIAFGTIAALLSCACLGQGAYEAQLQTIDEQPTEIVYRSSTLETPTWEFTLTSEASFPNDTTHWSQREELTFQKPEAQDAPARPADAPGQLPDEVSSVIAEYIVFSAAADVFLSYNRAARSEQRSLKKLAWALAIFLATIIVTSAVVKHCVPMALETTAKEHPVQGTRDVVGKRFSFVIVTMFALLALTYVTFQIFCLRFIIWSLSLFRRIIAWIYIELLRQAPNPKAKEFWRTKK